MASVNSQLNTDLNIPNIGLGMWKIEKPQVVEVVKSAIDCGYRHFDSACDYGNEAELGQGLKNAFTSGTLKRQEVWVTSKLWNTYHHPDHVRPALIRSLTDLQLDELDLYLIHFPIALRYVPFETRYPPGWFFDEHADEPRMETEPVPIRDTWQAMEQLVQEGLVKHIGISNFGCSLIRDLLSYADIKPAVLQIESHPYLAQNKLLRYCRESNIRVTAFSPLGAQSYFSLNMAQPHESLLTHAVIRDSATRHEKTEAQILLRWGIQRGTVVIPKASSLEHLKENLAVDGFELSREEMDEIKKLDANRRFNDPGDFCESAFNTFYPIYE